MSKIKEYIQKSPLIYKALYPVYHHIISPLTSGFILRYINYCYKDRGRDTDNLKKQGFQSIKQYNPRTWRFGKGQDNAYRRYYIAKFDEVNCFIKISENDETVKNEIKIHEYLAFKNFTQTPKCIKTDSSFSENKVMIAIRFIEDLSQIKTPKDEISFNKICDDFINISNFLYDHHILHADIHKGNLLQKDDGSLILLDFGISMAHSVDNTVNYIARPGTFFIQNENRRKYDDVYSFLKMLDTLNLNDELKQTSKYKVITGLIGRYSNEIDLNEFI